MICRICHFNGNGNRFSVNDKMFGGTKNFEYFECEHCGTLQITEIPEDMSIYYPNDYYSLTSKTSLQKKLLSNIRDYLFYLNFPKRLATKLAVKIPNLSLQAFLKVKPNKQGKVLDVGCGEGKFLKSIYHLGFRNIMGIDPYALKTTYLPFGIYKKNLFEVQGDFDIITFNHVFEHLFDVHAALQKCDQILRKDGLIIIRVPVKDSFAFKYYGENWVQWDAPRHLQIPTKKAIQILADEHHFQIMDYYNDSYKLQFTGSEKYKRGLSYQTENTIFSAKEINLFNRKSLVLNRSGKGDQIVVVLKKSS